MRQRWNVSKVHKNPTRYPELTSGYLYFYVVYVVYVGIYRYSRVRAALQHPPVRECGLRLTRLSTFMIAFRMR